MRMKTTLQLGLAQGELTAKAEAPLRRQRFATADRIVRAGVRACPFGQNAVRGLRDRRRRGLHRTSHLRAESPYNKRRRLAAGQVAVRALGTASCGIDHLGVNRMELNPLVHVWRVWAGNTLFLVR